MSSELSTARTIVILAVVVGCFAVLWPKVFYPMLTSSVRNSQATPHPHARPQRQVHNQPDAMHPALREKGIPIPHRTIEKQARPGPMPGIRPPMGGGGHISSPQVKGSGAMGIIMPIYTVGIIIFFVYTIMKVLFKRGCDEDKTPKLKDFHLDPEYRKYVFDEEYLDNSTMSHRDHLRRNERDTSKHRRRIDPTFTDPKIGSKECEKISGAISSLMAEYDDYVRMNKENDCNPMEKEATVEDSLSKTCTPQCCKKYIFNSNADTQNSISYLGSEVDTTTHEKISYESIIPQTSKPKVLPASVTLSLLENLKKDIGSNENDINLPSLKDDLKNKANTATDHYPCCQHLFCASEKSIIDEKENSWMDAAESLNHTIHPAPRDKVNVPSNCNIEKDKNQFGNKFELKETNPLLDAPDNDIEKRCNEIYSDAIKNNNLNAIKGMSKNSFVISEAAQSIVDDVPECENIIIDTDNTDSKGSRNIDSEHHLEVINQENWRHENKTVKLSVSLKNSPSKQINDILDQEEISETTNSENNKLKNFNDDKEEIKNISCDLHANQINDANGSGKTRKGNRKNRRKKKIKKDRIDVFINAEKMSSSKASNADLEDYELLPKSGEMSEENAVFLKDVEGDQDSMKLNNSS